jgi:hypothetical protein
VTLKPPIFNQKSRMQIRLLQSCHVLQVSLESLNLFDKPLVLLKTSLLALSTFLEAFLCSSIPRRTGLPRTLRLYPRDHPKEEDCLVRRLLCELIEFFHWD